MKTARNLDNGVVLLADSSRGIYVPQHFANTICHPLNTFRLDNEDLTVLEMGPDNAEYWDTWMRVLDGARYTDAGGQVWTLHHDGDLFAVCPHYMSDEQYADFFGV